MLYFQVRRLVGLPLLTNQSCGTSIARCRETDLDKRESAVENQSTTKWSQDQFANAQTKLPPSPSVRDRPNCFHCECSIQDNTKQKFHSGNESLILGCWGMTRFFGPKHRSLRSAWRTSLWIRGQNLWDPLHPPLVWQVWERAKFVSLVVGRGGLMESRLRRHCRWRKSIVPTDRFCSVYIDKARLI